MSYDDSNSESLTWKVFIRSAELYAYPDDIDGDRLVDELQDRRIRIRYNMVYSGLYECNEYNPL